MKTKIVCCTYWLHYQWSCETAVTRVVPRAQKGVEGDLWLPVGLQNKPVKVKVQLPYI